MRWISRAVAPRATPACAPCRAPCRWRARDHGAAMAPRHLRDLHVFLRHCSKNWPPCCDCLPSNAAREVSKSSFVEYKLLIINIFLYFETKFLLNNVPRYRRSALAGDAGCTSPDAILPFQSFPSQGACCKRDRPCARQSVKTSLVDAYHVIDFYNLL